MSGGGSFLKKLLAGAFAGMFGAITGNPLVILRTRMIINKGERKSIWLFIKDVLNEDGVKGFYKGFSAMFLRAIVLSSTKMAVYDTCKMYVKNRFLLQGIPLQFLSAFVAGFFLTCTVMPFDMIRTRMMTPSDGNRVGFLQCAK